MVCCTCMVPYLTDLFAHIVYSMVCTHCVFYDCCVLHHNSSLQLQRYCAAVVGDLSRSPVLMPVLEQSGHMREFIAKACACLVATVHITTPSSTHTDTHTHVHVHPLEPLLSALTHIATEYAPARSELLGALSAAHLTAGTCV
jgi:hypothetical protein